MQAFIIVKIFKKKEPQIHTFPNLNMNEIIFVTLFII